MCKNGETDQYSRDKKKIEIYIEHIFEFLQIIYRLVKRFQRIRKPRQCLQSSKIHSKLFGPFQNLMKFLNRFFLTKGSESLSVLKPTQVEIYHIYPYDSIKNFGIQRLPVLCPKCLLSRPNPKEDSTLICSGFGGQPVFLFMRRCEETNYKNGIWIDLQ